MKMTTPPCTAVNGAIVTMVVVVRPDTRSRAASADRIVAREATVMVISNADTISSGIALEAVLPVTLGRVVLVNLTVGRSSRLRSARLGSSQNGLAEPEIA